MTRLWAKREAQIHGVIESTVGMYGDLQGIAGKALQVVIRDGKAWLIATLTDSAAEAATAQLKGKGPGDFVTAADKRAA